MSQTNKVFINKPLLLKQEVYTRTKRGSQIKHTDIIFSTTNLGFLRRVNYELVFKNMCVLSYTHTHNFTNIINSVGRIMFGLVVYFWVVDQHTTIQKRETSLDRA